MNNSKVVIFLGCLFAAILTAPLVTAAAHGGGFSGGHSFAGGPGMGMHGGPGMGMHGGPGMGMRGGPGMGMRGPFMPPSMGRMPMQRAPMMNSPSSFRRFGDRNFNRNDRFGRFNRFNDGDFDRDDRFNRFNRFNNFNNFVFIGDFGFPWWWGWGWGPWWGGWGWGYPYAYYGGYDTGYYGSSYGYGGTRA